MRVIRIVKSLAFTAAPALAVLVVAGPSASTGAFAQAFQGASGNGAPPPVFGSPTTDPAPARPVQRPAPAQRQQATTGSGAGTAPSQAQQGQVPAVPNQPSVTDNNGDVVILQPPSQKIENTYAVYAGLDKITGRITSFDAALGETVQFGALQVTPRVCYTRPPTESQNTTSFTEVNEVTLKGEAKRIFTGWMFASSPGLHAVEHPIYDVWLTGCKASGPVTASPRGQQ